MRLYAQCTDGNKINTEVSRIEREESFIIAYREFMGKKELAAVIDLGAVDYLYTSEAK